MSQSDHVETWCREYALRERSAMRGGQRAKSRLQIRDDVARAFPLLGFLSLIYWAWRIWRMIREER